MGETRETVFDTPFSEFVYLRSYARWDDAAGRREMWPESVARYGDYMLQRVPEHSRLAFVEAVGAIERFEVMPSMRALWAAGRALDRENLAGYNCSALLIQSPRSFAEILYLLMNGCGVGFSVERQYVGRLPAVPESLEASQEEIEFADSKMGWAEGYYRFVMGLYKGVVYKCNLSKIRPTGARLKTFGGRASGPEPLRQLLDFTLRVFEGAKGRQLNSIECYDIACYICNVVVVGGVRRSASISLSNLSDRRMAQAKTGEFWQLNPQRMLSNNSVAYTEKPDCMTFMEEWLTLARSGAGERGIFNRQGAMAWMTRNGRRQVHPDVVTNPCGETLLRPDGLCNLTEAVIRPWDNMATLTVKAQRATILGMVQSTLTKFGFINRNWRVNAEQERLLGVSLTGLRDHAVLGRCSREAERWLHDLKNVVTDTADNWASILGINMPAATTCIKPSGTVSSLVGTASGLHPRFAPYYTRRIRVTANDPIAKMMVDQGIPASPEVGQTWDSMTTVVFDFPMESPEDSVFRDEVSAVEQLEYYLMVKNAWCEHTPSATIYVKAHEWVEVGSWVYKHWDAINGLTFLPYDGGVYQLAPYEALTEEQYAEKVAAFPKIDFGWLQNYEVGDNTDGAREFACAGGSCDI